MSPNDGLDRHSRKREAGVPSLSVLCGDPEQARSAWARWAASRRTTVVVVADASAEGLTRAVVAALRSRAPDDTVGPPSRVELALGGRALERLGRVSSIAELQRLAPDGERDVEATIEVLVRSGEGDEPWRRVLRVIGSLRPLPALLVDASSPTALRSAAATAARVVEALPSLPVALVSERALVRRFLAEAPETRAQALVREGLLELTVSLDPVAARHELGRALDREEADRLERSLAFLDELGAGGPLLGAFVQAAIGESRAAREPEQTDGARSAAERFLFELLEAFPDTRGRFALNAPLDFTFGPGRPVEVDLLAARERLAVEVDGYYHFRDADDWRRDRRKDLALQMHGHRVVRVLAADVVARLEETLATIRTALGPAL